MSAERRDSLQESVKRVDTEPDAAQVCRCTCAAQGRPVLPLDGKLRIALIGNPNSGKTTLFNALTGLHQKVGNYPGVTVEKKEGLLRLRTATARLIDLPGTYSLRAVSDDERVVRDLLFGTLAGEPQVHAVLVVIDATHLERQLFLVTQIIELGMPVVVVMTMNDEAERHHMPVDARQLEQELGVPVVAVHAVRGTGLGDLREALELVIANPPCCASRCLDDKLEAAISRLQSHLEHCRELAPRLQRYLALQLLIDGDGEQVLEASAEARQVAQAIRDELEAAGVAWREVDAQRRYSWIHEIVKSVQSAKPAYQPSKSDRLDRVLTHPWLGLGVFGIVMGVVFQSVFSWSAPLMGYIDTLLGWAGSLADAWLPAGPLRGLLVDGVIGGVGAVLVFLPQILLLFLFIALLEDSGYMARAAFLMNRHMRRAGLPGRSFIPLLCGFACAVPAIMATRSIPDKRDRLITMLIVPLVSCSARLPVYALMIAAFVPAIPLIGNFTTQGATLLSAYMLSLVAAVTCAFIFRKSVLRGEPQPLILELPPYRLPHWKTVLTAMWERGKLFVTQAGTIILAINIVLWFLASFPHNAAIVEQYAAQRTMVLEQGWPAQIEAEQLAALAREEAGEKLRNSYAGRMGRALEPLIAPLGFDWKIGIGLVGSFAAREVFVSTMATVYNLGNTGDTSMSLVEAMRQDVNPRTGKPVFNLLVSLNLILFYILACQCMSTVAVVKRETASWKWALFLVAYMTALAYGACLAVYQIGSRMMEL